MDRSVGLVTDGFPTTVERVCRHNSSTASAIGIIIHLILLIGCVIPDLVCLNTDKSPFLGSA
jgi:hypothetical protein